MRVAKKSAASRFMIPQPVLSSGPKFDGAGADIGPVIARRGNLDEHRIRGEHPRTENRLPAENILSECQTCPINRVNINMSLLICWKQITVRWDI